MEPQRKAIALDLIRALAALEVCLSHLRGGQWVDFASLPSAEQTQLTAICFQATRLGTESVMVFFVLSGYLVGGRVLRQAGDGRFDLADYAIDRTTRILLPLIPACLLTAAIQGLALRQPVDILTVVGNMVGLNGAVVRTLRFNDPLWSLAYEIWFYVAAGAAAFVWTRRGSLAAMLAVVAACGLLASMNAAYALFWALGAVAFAFQPQRPGVAAMLGALLAVAGVALIQLTRATLSPLVTLELHQSAGETLLCAGVALALPLLARAETPWLPGWARAAIAWGSGMSFSLYLVHFPVNAALDLVWPKAPAIDGASLAAFAGRLTIVLAASAAFWLVFERNTGALRRRLRRAQSARRVQMARV